MEDRTLGKGWSETMVADRIGLLYEPNTAPGLADRAIALWENHGLTEVQCPHAQLWVAERFSWQEGLRLDRLGQHAQASELGAFARSWRILWAGCSQPLEAS